MHFFCVSKELVYVTHYLDNNLTNPYLEWKKLGSPDFPSVKQFQQLRDAEVWCIWWVKTLAFIVAAKELKRLKEVARGIIKSKKL